MKGKERIGIKVYREAGINRLKSLLREFSKHCHGELLRDTGVGRGLKGKG